MCFTQTRARLRRGVGRRSHVRGAAVVRGGAGAGARRGRARAAVASAGAAAAQRVQAARAPLGLGRGRLVLAAPARALVAGRARAAAGPRARAARRRRAHLLMSARSPERSRFILGDRVYIDDSRCSGVRTSLPARRGSPPNSSIYEVLENLILIR